MPGPATGTVQAGEAEVAAGIATATARDWPEPIGTLRACTRDGARLEPGAPLVAVRGTAAELARAEDCVLGDHRPGQQAARERGAVFPLVDAGFTKGDVHEASRSLGLPTWDKPAAACLASRIPYGVPVTFERLGRVEQAEASLRRLGFRDLRVRHSDDTARIEIGLDELDRAVHLRTDIVAALHRTGYGYVTLDLEGFRSGNLNR